MNFTNVAAAVAALIAHAKAAAPQAADDTARLGAEVFNHLDAAEKAAAPVAAEVAVTALPLGEQALGIYLTTQLGPLLGPAASGVADVFIAGGARALGECLNPAPVAQPDAAKAA